MNSNWYLFIVIFLAYGCGVKNAPVEPKGSSIPSIEDEHPELKLQKNSIYRSRN